MSEEEETAPAEDDLASEFEPAALDEMEIRRRVFEATGHSIDGDDPVMIWQIILAASLEDQQRLVLQMRRELCDELDSSLKKYRAQTKKMLTDIRTEISATAIQERIATMGDQIERAGKLDRSLRHNVWLFRLFTFINIASVSAAASIFYIISQ